ncbi:Arylsulfatase A [Mariniphaga anaerophila]|uniref:Arylsulfatase A n=1 Tax=Mariniphaga anaerophila TaxID=1484053 RepID=A0A1M5FJF4_9BACT|nr:sulfatase-like hydrolase/transferase [Mariniphaga anaerophila]SHF91608.1 Arylsulfatase A [Mariniphaga anaerophila]
MKRYKMIFVLIAIFCFAQTNAQTNFEPESKKKPNILLILTDDMGYADLSVNGSKQVATPSIDRIADAGVTFTQAYVTGPVCGPSRCGLLSGMYQNRFGAEHNWNDFPEHYKEEYVGIDPTLNIMSDYIKGNGYSTAMIGKWHVGETKDMMPNARGFDYSFWMGGHHSYFPKADKNKLHRNDGPVTEIKVPYLTDWFTEEAIDWINKNHETNPWFVYLAYNTPHTPLQAKEEDLAKYAHIKDKKRQTYLAMQDCLNQSIGRIFETLESTGQLDNTIIIFTNDNGGPCGANASINAPYRGEKSTYLEGGVRVPLFISWPGKIKPGSKYEVPVTLMDLTPTLLAAIESTEEPETYEIERTYPDGVFDGVNLFPFIYGNKPEKARPHQTLYWRTAFRGKAIRDGDWKLIVTPHDLPMLYNLAEDVQEMNNLTLTMPEKARELKSKLANWEASLESSPRFFTKNHWLKEKYKQYEKDYILIQPER